MRWGSYFFNIQYTGTENYPKYRGRYLVNKQFFFIVVYRYRYLFEFVVLSN